MLNTETVNFCQLVECCMWRANPTSAPERKGTVVTSHPQEDRAVSVWT